MYPVSKGTAVPTIEEATRSTLNARHASGINSNPYQASVVRDVGMVEGNEYRCGVEVRWPQTETDDAGGEGRPCQERVIQRELYRVLAYTGAHMPSLNSFLGSYGDLQSMR